MGRNFFAAVLSLHCGVLSLGRSATAVDDMSALLQEQKVAARSLVTRVDSDERLDKAMASMRSGIEKIGRGTDLLVEAAEEYMVKVRPASLLGQAEKVAPSLAQSTHTGPLFKDRLIQKMDRMVDSINKDISGLDANMEAKVNKAMSDVSSGADDMRAGSRGALVRAGAFATMADEPVDADKVLSHSLATVDKVEGTVAGMKEGLEEFGKNLTANMKVASELVAKHLSGVIRQRVHAEVEQARGSAPSSLLQVAQDHMSLSGLTTATHALDTVRAAGARALEGLRRLVQLVADLVLEDVNPGTGMTIEKALGRANDSVKDMRGSMQGFATDMSSSLQRVHSTSKALTSIGTQES